MTVIYEKLTDESDATYIKGLLNQLVGSTSRGTPPELIIWGTFAAGEATIEPALPVGTEANDLLIMPLESRGTDPVPTAAGWTELGTETKENTRITLLYRIAAASNPTKTSDPGDHIICPGILRIAKGSFNPETPFHKTTKSAQAATKSVSISGFETTINNCFILCFSSGALPDSNSTAEFSGVANASLTGVAEALDRTRNDGDGGAISVTYGKKEAKGTVSATTVTAVTSAVRANMMIAIAPYPETQTTFASFSLAEANEPATFADNTTRLAFKAKKSGGSGTVTLYSILWEKSGEGLIKSGVVGTLTTSWSNFNLSLSKAQAESIDSWANMRVDLWATSVSGENTRYAEAARLRLVTPPAEEGEAPEGRRRFTMIQ